MNNAMNNTINSVRDWSIILVLFFVINIISAVLAAYLFYVAENHVPVVEVAAPVNTEDIKRISTLQNIIITYDKRQHMYDAALSTQATSTDPSL